MEEEVVDVVGRAQAARRLAEPDHGRALASLEALSLTLETSHPGAAASLREPGGDARAHPARRHGLAKVLASTNPV
jgi:hypothetical protein